MKIWSTDAYEVCRFEETIKWHKISSNYLASLYKPSFFMRSFYVVGFVEEFPRLGKVLKWKIYYYLFSCTSFDVGCFLKMRVRPWIHLISKFVAVRDMPQIHLVLGNLECKNLFMKSCWIFLRKPIDTSKLFCIYVRNIWEDTIHWKYIQILI